MCSERQPPDVKTSDDATRRVTATGLPFKDTSQLSSFSTGMNSLMAADTFGNGNGPPNTLPFRYTDDSTIMVPVRKSSASAEQQQEEGRQKEKKKKKTKSRFSFRRKKDVEGHNFDMKTMTRGDYLKWYAKDEEGRYFGEEEPAEDCILRHPEDIKRWREGSS